MAEAAAAAAPDKLQIEAAALLDLYDTLISVFAAVVLSGIVNNSLQAIDVEGWILALPLIRTSVKLRIVGVTKAVNWGLPGELVVIEDARVIFRVVDDINCEILVHITDDRGV